MTDIRPWHKLYKAERYRYIARFMHLDTNQHLQLDMLSRAYLVQWIFTQKCYTIQKADIDNNLLDLELGQAEYARVFLDDRIPFSGIYDLVTKLKGRTIKRIHIFAFGCFSPAQKQIKKEYPLLIDQRELDGVFKLVSESQCSYQKELLERKGQAHRVPSKSLLFILGILKKAFRRKSPK